MTFTLNSCLTSLYLEFQRAAMGLGAIEATVEEVRQLPIADPSVIAPALREGLEEVLERLSKSPVKTIFEELVNPDRMQMDDLILQSLGFENAEDRRAVLTELCDELGNIAEMRLKKARSLRKGKKTKEGLDLNLLAKNVFSRIGEDNLATFFKAHIAPVSCRSVALPKQGGPIEIENTLLGWRLRIGKKELDCSSEAQARYLRVFAEMGWDHAPVPNDRAYLSSIVDEWEGFFDGARAVLEEYTTSILQSRTRKLAIDTFWARMREEILTVEKEKQG